MELICYKINLNEDTQSMSVEMVQIPKDKIDKIVQYNYIVSNSIYDKKHDNYISSGGTSFFEVGADKVKVLLKTGEALTAYYDTIEGFEDLYQVVNC